MNKNNKKLWISVDLWGTVIKANPQFIPAKLSLIREYFPQLSEEKVSQAFQKVKNEFNSIIEETGYQPAEKTLYTKLFSQLNGGYANFKNLNYFITDYNNLAFNYHPLIFSQETSKYLEKLSEIGQLTVSSNTMFIRGSALLSALRALNIQKYFKSFNFSDERFCSKPSPSMYYCGDKFSDYHIGDNVITDGLGPSLVGSKSIIINSNEKTIKDAFNIITQNR